MNSRPWFPAPIPSLRSPTQKYPTASFPTFIEALIEFENDCKAEARGGGREYRAPSAAAFAAAGVVSENKFCKMTNLDWTIDSEEVRQRLGWRHASVLNDFEAVGYGVLAAEQADQHVIHPAKGKKPVAPPSPIASPTDLLSETGRKPALDNCERGSLLTFRSFVSFSLETSQLIDRLVNR